MKAPDSTLVLVNRPFASVEPEFEPAGRPTSTFALAAGSPFANFAGTAIEPVPTNARFSVLVWSATTATSPDAGKLVPGSKARTVIVATGTSKNRYTPEESVRVWSARQPDALQ